MRTPRPRSEAHDYQDLRELRTKGNALYRSFQFREAERLYEEGLRRAAAAGQRKHELAFLINLGGVRFAMFRYREAMEAFLDARRLAREIGDREMLAVASTNLSSLYLSQQDVNAGAEAAGDLLAGLQAYPGKSLPPLMTIQCAMLYARQGDFARAESLLRTAAHDASAAGDAAAEARAWDQLGYERLARGEHEAAEPPVVAAYRIRKLQRTADIQYSYYTLGLLRLAQGNGAAAARMFEECLRALAETPGALEVWRVLYGEGRAKAMMGDDLAALGDYLKAADSARRVRAEAIPADSVWTNTGVDQSHLYSTLVRTAARLYFASGDPALARIAFDAAEENRASGLRALIQTSEEWRRLVPAGYWETLSKLRAAEASPAAGAELRKLRYRLTEMEAEAGLELRERSDGTAPGALDELRRAMGGGEAYVNIHLDEAESYLWLVTAGDLRLLRLPGRSVIEKQASRLVRAVRDDSADQVAAGAELYRTLFGQVHETLRAKARWSLSLEGGLVLCPLSALVAEVSGGVPEYVLERHTIRLVPAAGLARHRRPAAGWDGSLVGVADPIYNTADPRRLRSGGSEAAAAIPLLGILPRVFAAPAQGAAGEMARLAASGREVQACFRAFGPRANGRLVLLGEAATVEGVRRALETRPAVVHFATQFVMSAR